eukprot:PhM_4_TR14186/c3_g1_i1/m.80759
MFRTFGTPPPFKKSVNAPNVPSRHNNNNNNQRATPQNNNMMYTHPQHLRSATPNNNFNNKQRSNNNNNGLVRSNSRQARQPQPRQQQQGPVQPPSSSISSNVDVLLSSLLQLSQHLAHEVRREVEEAKRQARLVDNSGGAAKQFTEADVDQIVLKVEGYFRSKMEEYTRLLDDEHRVITTLRRKVDEYAKRNAHLEGRLQELEAEVGGGGGSQSLVEALKMEKRGRIQAEEQAHEIITRQEHTIATLEAKMKALNGGVTPNKTPKTTAASSSTAGAQQQREQYSPSPPAAVAASSSHHSVSDAHQRGSSAVSPGIAETNYNNNNSKEGSQATSNGTRTSASWNVIDSFLSDVQSELDAIRGVEGERAQTLQQQHQQQQHGHHSRIPPTTQQPQQQQRQQSHPTPPPERSVPRIPPLRLPGA